MQGTRYVSYTQQASLASPHTGASPLVRELLRKPRGDRFGSPPDPLGLLQSRSITPPRGHTGSPPPIQHVQQHKSSPGRIPYSSPQFPQYPAAVEQYSTSPQSFASLQIPGMMSGQASLPPRQVNASYLHVDAMDSMSQTPVSIFLSLG